VRLSERRHQLIWNHHHLLLDGWCLPLLLKDVFALYEGLRQGVAVQLPPSRPYKDYIAWLQQQDLGQAESYWREKLKGFTAPTELGLERAGATSGVEEQEYSEQQLKLSEAATAGLQQLAREQQLTLNTIVQGAWGLLLSRYSGAEDVVFGTVVSGRPAELRGVEQMLGLFINTLPVRVRVRGELKVAEWLRELQAEQVELRQYEYSPLVAVQGWSEVERGRSLFESILVFENYPVDTSLREQGGSLKVSEVSSREQTNYPLTAVVVPGRQLVLRINYDSERFEAGAMARLARHFEVLLESIVAAPEQRLNEIGMLTADERQQLLVEWNDTSVAYPAEQCIHELFEQQVERTPEAVALVFETEQVSYRELNERANQLAHYLRQLGVGPEERVGICVERSVAMVVGLLGILKAGGAYVPLDTAYPEERLSFIIEDAGLTLLLTQQSVLAHLPPSTAPPLCLETEGAALRQQSPENLHRAISPANLAYLIYTSGSTGLPKAVMTPHRAVLRLLCNVDYVELGPRHTFLHMAPISFDASTFELWGA